MSLLIALVLLCLQSPRVRVHASHLDAATRAEVAATAERALATVEKKLDTRVEEAVEVHFVRRVADVPESVRRSFRPWTVAIAATRSYDTWVVADRLQPEPPDDLASVLEHELVHLALGDLEMRLSGGARSIPRWLHEGLAQHVARHILLSGDEELVWFRASTDRLLGWSELIEGFPAGQDESRVAYAQSASFTDYLDRRVGFSVVMAAVRSWLSGDAETLDDALSDLRPGTSFTHLTGSWIQELKSGRGLLLFLRGRCFEFLMILAVPILALVLYKRFGRERRAGARLEAWEDWERQSRSRDEQSEP